jgi:hypothetical protein
VSGDAIRGPAPLPPLGAAEIRELVRLGVALYSAGRFWEAHEALEAVWRRSPPTERAAWQGLIQAAAAMLHRERGNRHGLEAQGRAAIAKLSAPPPDGFPVETVRFVRELTACVEAGGSVPRMALVPASAGERGARRNRGS